MWIYTYIRADFETIDMGPYASEVLAEQDRADHASFGAITAGPFEKPEDYKLFKGEEKFEKLEPTLLE